MWNSALAMEMLAPLLMATISPTAPKALWKLDSMCLRWRIEESIVNFSLIVPCNFVGGKMFLFAFIGLKNKTEICYHSSYKVISSTCQAL
jgi:hypothetical protein